MNEKNSKSKSIGFLCIAIVLIALIISGIIYKTASDSSPSETTVLSPESAVDIYIANKNAWMKNPEYPYMQGHGYCLPDLNFDGIPELISSANDGSGRYSYNSFYKINVDNQTVEEIIPQSSQKYPKKLTVNFSITKWMAGSHIGTKQKTGSILSLHGQTATPSHMKSVQDLSGSIF